MALKETPGALDYLVQSAESNRSSFLQIGSPSCLVQEATTDCEVA